MFTISRNTPSWHLWTYWQLIFFFGGINQLAFSCIRLTIIDWRSIFVMRNNMCTSRSPRFQYNHLSKLSQVKLIYTTKIQSISLSSNRFGKIYAIGSLFDSSITSKPLNLEFPSLRIVRNFYTTSPVLMKRRRYSGRDLAPVNEPKSNREGLRAFKEKRLYLAQFLRGTSGLNCSVSARDLKKISEAGNCGSGKAQKTTLYYVPIFILFFVLIFYCLIFL